MGGYKDRGEVLSGYGRVCFVAFKYQYRLEKLLSAPLTFENVVILKMTN